MQGLCLTPQLVDQVPLSPHDRMLDLVVTPEEVIRVSDYRKLSLKYHPDKQTPETREAMKEEFVKITNGAWWPLSSSYLSGKWKRTSNSLSGVGRTAYRVLSDPERREKYDVYGIADEQGFKYVVLAREARDCGALVTD
ncbi:hypothetical protein BBJ28_00010568 [Nothophytophthora sp. Chile5]|nr:hypothetical protein BBJ28_00010568 [Nothophytophthora sp. Chile5]